ncbi:ABC-type multidrug transport system [Vibrio sp. JCM 19236]|nr:ABC-type multidrug transport system [Vibrio sp. JCM 19236]
MATSLEDKWLLASLTWAPILVVGLVWWIFSSSIARDLPVGIVDHESSAMSAEFVRFLDATDTLTVSGYYSSEQEAAKALRGGDIYAYVSIPLNFDRDVYLSNPPQVSVLYNSQFILVGKLINSAVLKATGTFDVMVETGKNLSKGNALTKSALGQAVSVQTQITPLFNLNSNYAQFLVSAIVPAIWQITIFVSTILALGMHQRLGTFSRDFTAKQLFPLLACYVPIFLGLGVAFLLWMYGVLGWPMQGSYLVLALGQLVTVIACMLVAALFFFVTMDPARAMSLAAALTAPSFAFMGVTFPATDMNHLALIWRSLLPISHYIEMQISQVSYGADAITSISHLAPMLAYLLVAVLLYRVVPKKVAQ